MASILEKLIVMLGITIALRRHHRLVSRIASDLVINILPDKYSTILHKCWLQLYAESKYVKNNKGWVRQNFIKSGFFGTTLLKNNLPYIFHIKSNYECSAALATLLLCCDTIFRYWFFVCANDSIDKHQWGKVPWKNLTHLVNGHFRVFMKSVLYFRWCWLWYHVSDEWMHFGLRLQI